MEGEELILIQVLHQKEVLQNAHTIRYTDNMEYHE